MESLVGDLLSVMSLEQQKHSLNPKVPFNDSELDCNQWSGLGCSLSSLDHSISLGLREEIRGLSHSRLRREFKSKQEADQLPLA
jgi:hypothetical protein